MDAFVLWLVSVMMVWVPAPESARDRYEAYARDAAMVAMDPVEAPLFRGESGRVQTALLLLSIASLEGYYRDDVDRGEVRGDGGNSWCLMQVNTGGERVVMRGPLYGYAKASAHDGWSGRDLVQDRRKCFRAALHIARESFKVCGNLSLYATGKCYRGGEPAGNLRLGRAKSVRVTWRDAAVGL